MTDTMPSDDAPSDADEPEDEAPAGDTGGGRPDPDRLDEVGQQIGQARATAEDVVGLREDQQPAYTESGEEEPADDQTITPPG
jgi:hypothetical protein